ncbi:MAG: aldehyde dehydrogenase family protein, partial [Mycobacterium sp.]
MTAIAEHPVLPEVLGFLRGSKQLLIGGAWAHAASGKTFPTTDPATGATLTEVAHGKAEDIDRAVRAAREAFDTGPWPEMKPNQRERLLWRVGDILSERAAEFGQLEALDNGKSAGIATAVDVAWAADVFRYYAGWATKI